MAGIGIITNPHAKLNKRNPNRQKLLSYIAGERGHLEITNNLEELSTTAKLFAEKDISILAINGGDGTISRTISAMVHAYGEKTMPKIALLRGGTMNMLADNLKIKGSPEELLFKLIEKHAHSSKELPHTSMRTLSVNGQYGFLFANGTSARFLEVFYEKKSNAFGVLSLVAKIVYSRIRNTSFYHDLVYDESTQIKSSNQEMWVKTPGIFCATVTKIPLGIPLFPALTSRDDFFQCLLILSNSNQLPMRIPLLMLSAKDYINKDKIILKEKEVIIHVPSEQNSPYTLDGELFFPQENCVKISLGPTLQFITL